MYEKLNFLIFYQDETAFPCIWLNENTAVVADL